MLRVGHPELWGWAGSLSWGFGVESPCETPGSVLETLLIGGCPRSSTGLNSVMERGTRQWGEARVREATFPTRALTPSCRICKRRFPVPTEPRSEDWGEHSVSFALGTSSQVVSSPLGLLKTHSPNDYSGNVHCTADGLRRTCKLGDVYGGIKT